MALSYATIQTRILQFLQDTGSATYDATELGYWIEDELKRFSRYVQNIVDVIYQVESREGTDVTGTASALTDLVKLQFLPADATKEKVVHNTTDDTWAIILVNSSTSVNTLSRDIMDANELYEIYNKRCTNKRQIYIGDMPPYLWVESVEYPIGTERNFIQISKDVIELDVHDSTIEDSDSTLTIPNNVDVLVKFAMPQVLSQLTDWEGALTAATEDEGDTSIVVGSLGSTEIIEVGEQFNLENHRSLYIITVETTTSANTATLTFYPPLEAGAVITNTVIFRKSTLQPNHEDLLERMVCSRAVQSDMIKYARSGAPLLVNYQRWINNNPLLNPVLIRQELESLANPRVAKICART